MGDLFVLDLRWVLEEGGDVACYVGTDMEETFGPYQKLVERAREIARIDSAAGLLSWDQETYMPARALDYRAEQMAFFGGWSHRRFTDEEVGGWIKACEARGFPADSEEAANVREWRRAYDRKTRIPAELVEELQRTQAKAREAWLQARKLSQFGTFLPFLETLIDLHRQMADCWGYAASPYDALLEAYEPGLTTSELRRVFGELLPTVIELTRAAPLGAVENPFEGEYPVAAQEAFNREVAAAFGFDFEAGRLDTTAHPFCSGIGPGDCRLTTRYRVGCFLDSLYGVLHEVGHGLYEQGLRVESHGLPVGSAASLGIHESQSRLWENHVGRDPAFWRHWLPRAAHYFPSLRRFEPDELTAYVNRVTPSLIRVEADETTYDLHIVLRFELEVGMLEGTLKGSEVPEAWNDAFRRRFGLDVPDDARGCLQDIHWSLGLFGYFPTYTLGNLAASQLFACARRERPGLDAALGQGSYGELREWLRDRVHARGQQFLPGDLIRRVCGESLQAAYHRDHLRAKGSCRRSG